MASEPETTDSKAPSEDVTREKKETDPKNGEDGNDNQHCPSYDFSALIDAISREARANRDEERREDRGKRFREYLTLFFVVLTAGGILYQAYIFSGQLDEMKGASVQTNKIVGANAALAEAAAKQANAADKQANALSEAAKVSRENMIAAERAWVGPRNAKIDGNIEVGKPFEIVVEYANSGREPALDFIYTLDAFPEPAEDETNGVALAKLRAYLKGCQTIQTLSSGQVVFPSTGFSSYNLTTPISAEIADQPLVNGDTTLIVQGCFLYKSFNIIRHSYFCYFYKAKKTKPANLNICMAGHYAD